MAKLSEQLADLSARAKNTEDAMSAAQKEAHGKIVARKDQARAAATKAMETVNQEIKSVGDSASKNWSAVKAKIDADMISLKADVARVKHDRDVKRAEKRAENWSGRPASPSTMPSHRSSRPSWRCSMRSTAASLPKKPSKREPNNQHWRMT